MKLLRRRFLHLAAGASALPVLPRVATATDYPTRPIRIIVGVPAGLSPDLVARVIGEFLSGRLGQSIIVDNHPGAATNLAAEIVLKAQADGYMLLMAVSGNAINATLYPNLNFHFVQDSTPIAFVASNSFLMVINPSVPAKSVAEFIAYAKANPGKIYMASQGVGIIPHLCGEQLKMMTGIDLVHVPYRSSFLPDLLGGRVQVAFLSIAASLDYVRSQKLRALAVTTATRSTVLPDLPTVGESVPGYEAVGWFGIVGPKGLSTAIVDKLNAEINAVVADPKIKERLAGMGVDPMPMTPIDFSKRLTADVEKWGKVIKFANIKPE